MSATLGQQVKRVCGDTRSQIERNVQPRAENAQNPTAVKVGEDCSHSVIYERVRAARAMVVEQLTLLHNSFLSRFGETPFSVFYYPSDIRRTLHTRSIDQYSSLSSMCPNMRDETDFMVVFINGVEMPILRRWLTIHPDTLRDRPVQQRFVYALRQAWFGDEFDSRDDTGQLMSFLDHCSPSLTPDFPLLQASSRFFQAADLLAAEGFGDRGPQIRYSVSHPACLERIAGQVFLHIPALDIVALLPGVLCSMVRGMSGNRRRLVALEDTPSDGMECSAPAKFNFLIRGSEITMTFHLSRYSMARVGSYKAAHFVERALKRACYTIVGELRARFAYTRLGDLCDSELVPRYLPSFTYRSKRLRRLGLFTVGGDRLSDFSQSGNLSFAECNGLFTDEAIINLRRASQVAKRRDEDDVSVDGFFDDIDFGSDSGYDSDLESLLRCGVSQRCDEDEDPVDVCLQFGIEPFSRQCVVGSLTPQSGDWAAQFAQLRIDLAHMFQTLGADIRFIGSVAVLLDALWTATGPRQVCNAFAAFLLSFPDGAELLVAVWNTLSDQLLTFIWPQSSEPATFLEKLYVLFRASGVDETVRSMWSNVCKVLLTTIGASLFSATFGLFIPSSFTQRVSSAFVQVGDFDSLFTLAQDLVSECVKACCSFVRGESHQWFRGSTIVNYLSKGDTLIAEQDTRSVVAFDPIKGGLTIETYLSDLEALIEEGVLLLTVHKNSPRAVTVQARQLALKKLVASVRALLNSIGQVPAPYVAALFGPPKIGKTVFTRHILDVIAEEYHLFAPGQPHDAMPLTYVFANTKHIDGYAGHKLVLMDDIAMKGRKHVDTEMSVEYMMKFANNVCTPLAMAAVEDKGKFYSNIHGLVLTSNDPKFGFDCFPNPGAPIRRVNAYVTISVKPQYRLEGNMCLDPSKVGKADTMKVWSITVNAPGATPFFPYFTTEGPLLLQTDNLAEYLRFLREHIREHQSAQERLMENLARRAKSSCCFAGIRLDAHTANCGDDCDFEATEALRLDQQGAQEVDPQVAIVVYRPAGDPWDAWLWSYIDSWFASSSNSTGAPLYSWALPPIHFLGINSAFHYFWQTLGHNPVTALLKTLHYSYYCFCVYSNNVLFPPLRVNTESPMPAWGTALLNGNYRSALGGSVEGLFGYWVIAYSVLYCVLLAPLTGLTGLNALCSLSCSMAYVWYGEPLGGPRTKWEDLRHALLSAYCVCDTAEFVVVACRLFSMELASYDEVMSYLYLRPKARKLRVVTVTAALAVCGAVMMLAKHCYISWRDRRGKELVQPEGASATGAWEPTPTRPWANAVTHYHDPSPGAVHQLPREHTFSSLSSRLAVIKWGSEWSNAFCVSGDTYLLPTHCVPPLPSVAEVFHCSRTGHRFEPVSITLDETCRLDLGQESTLLRLPGLRLMSSCISLFRSEHAGASHYEVVNMAVRTLTSGPKEMRFTGYQPGLGGYTDKRTGARVHVGGSCAVGESENGHCGAPVYTLSPRPTILGIHWGGGGNPYKAWSTNTYAEMLAYGLDALRERQIVPMPPIIPQGYHLGLLSSDAVPYRVEPHVKSVFNADVLPVDFLFREPSGSANPGTDVCQTSFFSASESLRAQVGLNMSPPVMAPFLSDDYGWVDPFQHLIAGLRVDNGFDLDAWKRHLTDLCSLVDLSRMERVSPLSMHQMFNGTPGRGGLTKLNVQTSAGMHYHCKKSALVRVRSDGVIEPLPRLTQEFVAAMQKIERGEMLPNFFTCSLKDEPVSSLKAAKGETRVIQVPGVVFTLLVRRYASIPLMLATQSMPEVAIGMNCYSLEANDWVERMRRGRGTPMDVDIKKLDRSFSGQEFLLCIAFTRMCAKWCGYTNSELAYLNTICFGMYKPVFCLRGSYFVGDSLNASGHPLTALWNSVICLSLYTRWYRACKLTFSPVAFRDDVTLSVYGDDAALVAGEGLTFQALVESFAKSGFVATPGRKEALEGAVESVSELTFLKRTPRFHEGLHLWVMALDKKSVVKMLSWKVKSRYLSEFDHELAMVTNAVWEAFLWGDDFYEQVRSVVPSVFAGELVLPDLDKVWKRFTSGEIDRNVLQLEDVMIQSLCASGVPQTTIWGGALTIRVTKEATRIRASLAPGESSPIRSLSNPLFRGGLLGGQSELEAECTDVSLQLFKQSSAQSNTTTTSVDFQSEVSAAPTTAATTGTLVPSSVAVQFIDDASTYSTKAKPAVVGNVASMHKSVPLDLTLMRPLRIYQFSWTPASTIVSFDPLALWMAQPLVAERLRGCIGFKANFVMRATINGTAMHWGRLSIVNEPYPKYHSELCALTKPAPYSYVNYSQMKPMKLDPSTNESKEQELPFVSPNDFYGFDATSFSYGTYGPVYKTTLIPFVPILQLGGATDPVIVNIYLFVSEFERINNDTNTTLITPQSGTISETWKISEMASVLADGSARARDLVPSMAPYFMAGEAALRVGSAAASALGYSNPSNPEPPQFARVKDTTHFASSTTLSTATKLAFDQRAQVSVDPRIVSGSCGDEMTITSIAMTPSWIRNMTWTQATPMTAPLSVFPVLPCYVRDSITSVQFTACGFASISARGWCGTMVFDFDFVASKFHSGRLLFAWSRFPAPSLTELQNWCPNRVVDVATTKKLQIRVPYSSPFGYIPVRITDVDAQSVSIPYQANGYLIVYPLTTLVSQLDSDGVTIATEISAGPDFELTGPTSYHLKSMNLGIFPAPAGFAEGVPSEEEVEPQSGGPVEPTEFVASSFAPENSTAIAPVYAGERYTSIRQLIKRTNLFAGCLSTSAEGSKRFFGQIPMYPYPRGYENWGSQSIDYWWTPSAFYGLGFVGLRGGSTWRFYLNTSIGRPPITSYEKLDFLGGGYQIPSGAGSMGGATPGMATNVDTWAGANEEGKDRVHESTLLYRSKAKWLPAPFPNGRFGSPLAQPASGGATLNEQSLEFFSDGFILPTGGGWVEPRYYHAGDDDFSLSWFVCGPALARP